jgi:hypothetical protein
MVVLRSERQDLCPGTDQIPQPAALNDCASYGEAVQSNPQIIDLGNLDKLREKLLTLCNEPPQFRMTTGAKGILGK